MAVYADILWLINMSMDFLCLYLTGRLLHKPLRRWPILLAACLGATGGTVYIVLDVPSQNGWGILFGILLSVGMVWIAFGRPTSARMLLRDSLSLWGAGTLIGGVMTVLLSHGTPVYVESSVDFAPVFLVCVLVSVGLTRLFATNKGRRYAMVALTAGEQRITVRALCDSGSFAAEPMSGKPVILLAARCSRAWERELHDPACRLRLRMIPLRGLGGDTLLYGLLPDVVEVDGVMVDAAVALYDGDFVGADALLPAVLCPSMNGEKQERKQARGNAGKRGIE